MHLNILLQFKFNYYNSNSIIESILKTTSEIDIIESENINNLNSN